MMRFLRFLECFLGFFPEKKRWKRVFNPYKPGFHILTTYSGQNLEKASNVCLFFQRGLRRTTCRLSHKKKKIIRPKFVDFPSPHTQAFSKAQSCWANKTRRWLFLPLFSSKFYHIFILCFFCKDYFYYLFFLQTFFPITYLNIWFFFLSIRLLLS